MTIFVTREELDRFRTELADDPLAVRVLDVIEDCEGDLEDAAIAIALRVGQEPDRSDNWLAGLAKRWRVPVCQPDVKAQLVNGSILAAVRSLTQETEIPDPLAIPVVLYVWKTGAETFCKPLEEQL